ncbi:MAG: hypothetical protein COA99_02920 [Moraxellaceae bacterium]|nr:MAG: hypothetical protein COA99_02920 [Moraxellaceae bacterium]
MDNREYRYDTHVYQDTNNINSISYLGVRFYFMKFTAQKSFIAPLIISTMLLTGGLSGCAMLGLGGEKTKVESVQTPAEPTSNDIMKQIQDDIKSWRLSSPKGNNALEKIEFLKNSNASSSTVSGLTFQVANRYMELADRAIAGKRNPSRKDLNKAQLFIESARRVSPNSKIFIKKEQKILDLLTANKQKSKARKIAKAKKKAQQAKLKKQAAKAEKARATAAEALAKKTTATTATAPPPSNIMSMPTKRPKSTDDLLVFSQLDVDSQSRSIEQEIDNIARRIIAKKASAVIHARSEKDYRWLNGSLKTSIYLLKSSFNLDSTADINPDAYPSIEIVK